MFVTIGAALTGPVGGVIIGTMAVLVGITTSSAVALPSLLAHVAGAVWMGFAYKKLVYERLRMPVMLLGWVGLIVVFYYGFMVLIVLLSFVFLKPALFVELFGENSSFLQAYAILGKTCLAEMLLTAFITTLVIFALPRKYRRPLW